MQVQTDVSSAVGGFPIVPNDSLELEHRTRGIYVGVSGDIVAKLEGDDDLVTFIAVPQGTILPVRAIKVTTATTATNLIGLY